MITSEPRADLDVLLRRSRPVFLLLDSSLGVVSAEPDALKMLGEAYGEPASFSSGIPDGLAAALREHCNRADCASVAIPIRDVVVHLRALHGDEDYYLVSIERIARRDHLKQSTKRYSLTRREGEVLSLILHGKRAGDIASELGISPATVSDHFTNLLRKTGSRNRAEMLAKLMDS